MKSFAVVFFLSLKQKDANQLREEYSRLVQGTAGGGGGGWGINKLITLA